MEARGEGEGGHGCLLLLLLQSEAGKKISK